MDLISPGHEFGGHDTGIPDNWKMFSRIRVAIIDPDGSSLGGRLPGSW